MPVLPSYITSLIVEKVIKATVKAIPKAIKMIINDDNSKVIAYQESEENRSAIIFVHGFSGSPEETFKNVPELLKNEPKLDGYDILSVGYSSKLIPDIGAGIWSADPDIDNLSEYFNTLIRVQFAKYDRICIVAHSMGGLIVQKAILKLDDGDLSRITHLLMFGTPSAGLKIANKSLIRWLKKTVKNMGAESEFITKLRADWSNRFTGNYPFEFKAVAGLTDEFVQRFSSIEVFEERYRYQIGGNHLTMVKADSTEDVKNQCFTLIVNDLSPTTPLQGDPFTLHQLMAESEQVVKKLKPNAQTNEIDVKGLRNLALALDTLGRDDEAIAVIEANDLLSSNTDVMGILGGRYKRKYLFYGNKKSDADKAMEYYTKALGISKENDNRHQIYYHAINLAFMSLMYLDDEAKMIEFANLAKDHCDENSERLWELATLAEAYLYLENRVKSKEYYEKVVGMTQDKIRDRGSIYINAKFAYEELNN